jgi:hypothetical protein
MGGSSLDGFLSPIGINHLLMTLEHLHHFFIKNGSSTFEEYVIGEPHKEITLYTIWIAKEYH